MSDTIYDCLNELIPLLERCYHLVVETKKLTPDLLNRTKKEISDQFVELLRLLPIAGINHEIQVKVTENLIEELIYIKEAINTLISNPLHNELSSDDVKNSLTRMKAIICSIIGQGDFLITRFETSKVYRQMALNCAQSLGDSKKESVARVDLGNTQWYLREEDSAISNYYRAIELTDDVGVIGRAWTGLGNAYCTVGKDHVDYNIRYHKSLEFHKKRYEAMDPREKARGAIGIATTYRLMNETEKAREYADIAIAGKDMVTKTHGFQEKALAYFVEYNLTEAELCCLDCINLRKEAMQEVNNTGNRIALFGGQSRSYELLYLIKYLQGKHKESLEIVDKLRKQELLNKMKKDNIIESIEPLTWQEMQGYAKSANCHLIVFANPKLVHTLVSSINYYIAWVIPPEGDINHVLLDPSIKVLIDQNRIPEEKEGVGLFRDFNRTVSCTGRRQSSFYSSRLPGISDFGSLFEPILKYLPTPASREDDVAPSIMLFCDGDLSSYCFEGLMCEDGRYLNDMYTITQCTSIKLQVELEKIKNTHPISKDIVYALYPNVDLNLAVEEFEICKEILESNQIKVQRIGDIGHVSEELFINCLKEKWYILVIGSHGRAEFCNYIRSREITQPDSLIMLSTDEVIRSEKIMQGLFKLFGRIVILNCCQTMCGSGSSEGSLSTAYAYLHTGVTTVIGTKCEISDEFASKFIPTLFYNALKYKNWAQALRKTRIHYIDHPEWHSYTMIGLSQF